MAAALDGARAILVERFAEDADLIGALREADVVERPDGLDGAQRGKKTEGEKFKDYFDFSEPLTKLPSHRILALFRGEKEEILDLQLQPEREAAGCRHDQRLRAQDHAALCHFRPGPRRRQAGWSKPCAGRGVPRSRCISTSTCACGCGPRRKPKAVRVFASNLRDLLLAAPAGARVTMGLDPGYRTGVKVAVVDATGKVVDTDDDLSA